MGKHPSLPTIAKYGFSVFAFLTVLIGLYVTKLHSYPLFHTLAEMFAIVIAYSIFVVAWNARRFLNNSYLLLLGVAFFFVGAVDLVHTLAYKGLGIFPGYGTNLPTQLWIVARSLQAFSLLIAPLVIGRRLDNRSTFGVYAIITALLISAVFWRVFPDCYVEGVGLTPLKMVSEYVICVALIGALVLLFHKKKSFDAGVYRLLGVAIVVAIFSEYAFTLYVDVFGTYNMIGHLLKIISFYLIYRAIVVTGFSQPYTLLFRELKEQQDALRDSEEKYRLLFDNSLNGFAVHEIVVDEYGRPVDYVFLQVNRAFEELTGLTSQDVVGKRVTEVLSGADIASFIETYGNVALTGEPVHFEQFSSDLQRHYEITAFCPKKGQFATIFSDTTERKHAEISLAWESRVNAAMAELSGAVVSMRTIEEMSDLTLAHARRLTGSSFGFVGYIDPETGSLISPTLTMEIWDSCRMTDKQFIFHEFRGLWGWVLNNRRSLMTNSPDKDARSSGIPEGHVPIERFIAAPAMIGDRLVGIVSLANPDNDYGERDLVVIERVASLYALAIQRRELYERERKIAETLQHSFLPDALPELEGYELADCYRPGRPEEAAIGGDVYDVFSLSDGRTVVAIADVSGKGLRAARYGAMIKYMLRAYAYRTDAPHEVLRMLNSSLAHDLGSAAFVTCFLGILDPSTGAFTYANAGHDNPLYIPNDNAHPERLEVTGVVLGAMPEAVYTSHTVNLQPGDMILLYTDGVTDARGVGGRMEIEGLESLIAQEHPESASEVVECVLAEVDRRSGSHLADDVAMLVLRMKDA